MRERSDRDDRRDRFAGFRGILAVGEFGLRIGICVAKDCITCDARAHEQGQKPHSNQKPRSTAHSGSAKHNGAIEREAA